jgi:hypothetical protein
MAENFTHGSHEANSDSEVQEIEPLVLVRSTRKKRHRRLLWEHIDRRFCHSSQRNKKGNEDSTNTSDSTLLQDTTIQPDQNLVKDSETPIR